MTHKLKKFRVRASSESLVKARLAYVQGDAKTVEHAAALFNLNPRSLQVRASHERWTSLKEKYQQSKIEQITKPIPSLPNPINPTDLRELMQVGDDPLYWKSQHARYLSGLADVDMIVEELRTQIKSGALDKDKSASLEMAARTVEALTRTRAIILRIPPLRPENTQKPRQRSHAAAVPIDAEPIQPTQPIESTTLAAGVSSDPEATTQQACNQ